MGERNIVSDFKRRLDSGDEQAEYGDPEILYFIFQSTEISTRPTKTASIQSKTEGGNASPSDSIQAASLNAPAAPKNPVSKKRWKSFVTLSFLSWQSRSR